MSVRNQVIDRVNRFRRRAQMLLNPEYQRLRVPRQSLNPGPRNIIDFAKVRENAHKISLEGSHVPSARELGEQFLPSRSVLPTDLRAGNHLQPGRMGHTRPEPSPLPRSKFPEAVDSLVWEPTKIAHVPPKVLVMGSDRTGLLSTSQDSATRKPVVY